MPVRLHHIVVDAHDLPGLARFRTQAPGWKVLSGRENEIVIRSSDEAQHREPQTDPVRGMSVRFRALMRWPPDWQFVWQLSAGAALFLVTVVGLLLPPVRAYAGLVHR
jgi:hypothetical protein